MNPYLKTALVTAALAVSQPRMGLSQDARIATVDTETLIRKSDEGKAAEDKVQKRYEALVAEMDKNRKDIDSKETRLREQDRLMSAAAKTQLSREIQEDKIRFDRKNEDYQKEMAELENTLLAPISGKVQDAVSAYVSEKGYTILVDLSTPKGNVVWANPRNDITAEVMKRLNEAYKKSPAASAPAAPATPAAPAGTQAKPQPPTPAPAPGATAPKPAAPTKD